MDTAKRNPEQVNFQIQQVAHHYRSAQLLRGWIRFGLVTLGILAVTTVALAALVPLGISRTAVLPLAAMAEAAAFWMLLVKPWRVPITSSRIALYIEEHLPGLENRLVSAVEFSAGHHSATTPWMMEHFYEDLAQATRRVSIPSLVDLDMLVKMFLTSCAFLLLSLAWILSFHSLWLPSNFIFLSMPGATLASRPFTVEPGNARVRQGESQAILVKSDTPAELAAIRWRTGENPWQVLPLERAAMEGVFNHSFTDVQQDIQYQVELDGKPSDVFILDAWLPPEVTAIDVNYEYPAYLGLPPRPVPNAGNLSAVEGTSVQISAWVNQAMRQAEMVTSNNERLPLKAAGEQVWTASFPITHNDTYHIELKDEAGAASEWNPEYTITAISDRPPEIKLNFPKKDLEVISLEEIPYSMKVTDDFGLKDYGLQYEVAGREPARLSLKNSEEPLTETEASKLLMLETLNLEAGDVTPGSAWAQDHKPGRPEYEELGDPFFIEIRPFQRFYEEAISDADGRNQQQQQDENQSGAGADQRNQKEIIIATWNLRRQFSGLQEEDFQKKRDAIVEAQDRLLTRYTEETQDPLHPNEDLATLKTAMQNAIAGLKEAALPDPAGALSRAMTHEQTAYRMILKMQPDRAEVQQRQSQGGQQNADQRPEISELELDRQRNFYEEENRTQSEMEQNQRTLDNLQDLTQRQNRINDDLSKLISESQQPQEIAEAERKRQLERLIDDQRKSLSDLDQMDRDLAMNNAQNSEHQSSRESVQDARQQAQRSLENLQNNNLQQARNAGARALSAMNELNDRLQQLSREGALQRMRDLQQHMNELVQNQESILGQVNELKQAQDNPSASLGDQTAEQKEAIRNQKNELAQNFTNLMNEAGEISDRTRQSQELPARKLGDWARKTSQRGILEDIQQEEKLPLIQYGLWDSAEEQENKILTKMEDSAKELEAIESYLAENEQEGMQKALNELRRLADANNANRQGGNPQAGRANVGEGSSALIASAQQNRQNNEEPREGSSQNPNGQDPNNPRGSNPSQQNQDGQNQPGGNPQGQNQPGQNQQGGNQQGGNQRGGNQPGGNQPGENQRGGNQGRGGPRIGDNPSFGDEPNSGGIVSRDGSSGPGNDGPWEWFMDPFSPDQMRQFMENDYQPWQESLRNAESLLPRANESRQQIARIREQLEELRHNFRDTGSAPKYDLFLETVSRPLAEAASRIERNLLQQAKEQEAVYADEGDVPSVYQKPVAEYFKALSGNGPMQP